MIPATLVVDASVVIKWVLNEEGRPPALRLLQLYQDGVTTLLAPRLLFVETGNVLWKHVQRGSLDAPQAMQAFDRLMSNAPVLASPARLESAALRLALAHRQTAYDSLYLALAIERQCELITADARLFSAVHRVLPFVHRLDRFEPLA